MLEIHMKVSHPVEGEYEYISWKIVDGNIAVQTDGCGSHFHHEDTYNDAAQWILEQVVYCVNEMGGEFVKD